MSATPIDFYDSSFGLVEKALTTLRNLLQKASESPDAASYIEARLAPDMYPLPFQVFTAARISYALVEKVAGGPSLELPAWETLKTYEQLIAVVDQVQAQIKTVDRAAFNKKDVEACQQVLPVGTWNLTGKTFALHFVIPNVFFHVQTTYSILRSKGLQLGKGDYLGPFVGKPDAPGSA